MYTKLLQQHNWTTNAAPSPCSDVHQHLDDVPYLLDELPKGANVHPVMDSQPARSFSLSSNAEVKPIYFSA